MNDLAVHMENRIVALEAAVVELREEASAELERHQSAWQPIAAGLASWLSDASRSRREKDHVRLLTKAESWVKEAAADIRDEGFEPIAREAAGVWKLLRQQSNVDLGRIELEGSASRRRVKSDVVVDGVPGVALGVMSQGELHSLALSLFLPRAKLDDSPFRFIAIDDPVQSMDPARVDGPARRRWAH
ncbi:MAG: hypothetical protein ACE5JX_18525 [Acidobacteriota bacterium]